jgi:hypothetical protein
MTIPATILCSAMDRVLEEMYFCVGSWTGPGPLDSSAIGARLTFTGAIRGEFRVLATPRLATQLAADFLAIDSSEITDAQAVALVSELANVACGATLSDWMPDGDFNFSVPSSLGQAQIPPVWNYRLSVEEAPPELAVDLIVY